MGASASGIKAGRAYVEAGVDNNPLTKGLKLAENKLQAWGANVTSIGKKVFAAGAAITAPRAGTAKLFASMGSELTDVSKRTGVSVESLPVWDMPPARPGPTWVKWKVP